MFKFNNKTPERRSTAFIVNFVPFSIVAIVDFR